MVGSPPGGEAHFRARPLLCSNAPFESGEVCGEAWAGSPRFCFQRTATGTNKTRHDRGRWRVGDELQRGGRARGRGSRSRARGRRVAPGPRQGGRSTARAASTSTRSRRPRDEVSRTFSTVTIRCREAGTPSRCRAPGLERPLRTPRAVRAWQQSWRGSHRSGRLQRRSGLERRSEGHARGGGLRKGRIVCC